MSKPVLFLLEDNRSLAERLERMAKRLGWEIVTARSLEGAREACRRNPHRRADAALIDLMIPDSEAALDRVDDLLAQRNAKSSAVTGRAPTTSNREMAIAEIGRIDRLIEELILDDGGIRFMSSEEGRRLLAGTKTAVFSARREGRSPDAQRVLSEAVVAALGRQPEEWFSKPTNPLELESWLTK